MSKPSCCFDGISMLNTVIKIQTFSCWAETSSNKLSTNIWEQQKWKSKICTLYVQLIIFSELVCWVCFKLLLLLFFQLIGSVTFFRFLHFTYVPWNLWVCPKKLLLQPHLLMSTPNTTPAWSPLHSSLFSLISLVAGKSQHTLAEILVPGPVLEHSYLWFWQPVELPLKGKNELFRK